MLPTYGAVLVLVLTLCAATVYVAMPGALLQPVTAAEATRDTNSDILGKWVRMQPEAWRPVRVPEAQFVTFRADATFRWEVRSEVETLWAEGTYARRDASIEFSVLRSSFPEGLEGRYAVGIAKAGDRLVVRTGQRGFLQGGELARIGGAEE